MFVSSESTQVIMISSVRIVLINNMSSTCFPATTSPIPQVTTVQPTVPQTTVFSTVTPSIPPTSTSVLPSPSSTPGAALKCFKDSRIYYFNAVASQVSCLHDYNFHNTCFLQHPSHVLLELRCINMTSPQ